MKLGAAGLAPLLLLAACAANPISKPFDQSGLPAAVRVPAGNKVSIVLAGNGEMTYQCRHLGSATGRHGWVFVAPDTKLMDGGGTQVGRYFGTPATWDYWAGSRVTGNEVATAPGGAGNLPLQLVKANPATGSQGAMTGTTFIQRVNVQGGVAPDAPCEWINVGQTRAIKYQADYVFYRAM
ncbi:MAG TPA: DUF3455 domain-containing protein [Ramlibacter sp.]|nr:DUF3455 domain-containing protein [Ramlibacter sp.]